jgi:transglutaminase-like putative cysteine protease
MTNKSLIVATLCLIILSAGCADLATPSGEKLFLQALRLEKQADYFQAYDLYKKAAKELRREGKQAALDLCRAAIVRTANVTLTYPLTEEKARAMIKQKFPQATDRRIDEVFRDGRLPQMKIGGRTYYFEGFTNTLVHLYRDFRSQAEAGALGKVEGDLYSIMTAVMFKNIPAKPGQTLVDPRQYLAEGELVLKRADYPDKGVLKVWLPLPLVTPAQRDVKIIAIYPAQYIKYPVKLDGDIALAYLEIPLAEVKSDLKIGAKFSFSHYQERFQVDPDKIGAYDKGSSLYKRYTASDRNIALTPAIRAAAKKLAAGEKNPYKIAKKFFDHIVWDLDYSFTPHGALYALNSPEAVYVLEHGYGDCGAQSMFFAALCRSVGIPARSPGGMQLFPINAAGCGDHFWAQIYLPNYGWIPVDTSAGQLCKYIDKLSDRQKHDFADYFFGNMEPFRYLIQTDVDVPFIPRPDEPPAMGVVLQEPAAICREMDESPGLHLADNWKITVKPIKF